MKYKRQRRRRCAVATIAPPRRRQRKPFRAFLRVPPHRLELEGGTLCSWAALGGNSQRSRFPPSSAGYKYPARSLIKGHSPSTIQRLFYACVRRERRSMELCSYSIECFYSALCAYIRSRTASHPALHRAGVAPVRRPPNIPPLSLC